MGNSLNFLKRTKALYFLIHQFIKFFICILMCVLYFPFLKGEDSPNIEIFKDQEDLGKACAREIADLILANQAQELPTILGLATGSSPLPVYKAFKDISKNENLDLSHVITFNLDEYCELPPQDPQSYHSFMFSNLFNDLLYSPSNPKGLRLENIHILNGYAQEEKDLSSEEVELLKQQFPYKKEISHLTNEEKLLILNHRAEKYDDLINEKGPIHIQLIGIGTNGHIGFAEPGSSLEGRTTIIELSENTRKDNSRFFNDTLSDVPTHALTMGIGTILQAERIILIASGEKKASIIEKTLSYPISSEIPATALRLHPNVSFFLDASAASTLQQKKTFRY